MKEKFSIIVYFKGGIPWLIDIAQLGYLIYLCTKVAYEFITSDLPIKPMLKNILQASMNIMVK